MSSRRLALLRRRRGLTQENLAEIMGVSRSTVIRWEAGTAEPQPYHRRELARALAVPATELDTALEDCTPPAPQPAHHDSHGLAGSAADAMDFVSATTLNNPPPRRVGITDVDHIRTATSLFATSENVHGGGLALAGATGQLRWAAGLLSSQCTGRVRAALLEAVGNLAAVVGFSAFDIADHTAASRCFRFSLWCAEQAESWALRASTLTDMARQAKQLGDISHALTLVETAQVRADRLPATGRAAVWTAHADLLALTGRHREARADISQADAFFADRDPATDPPWLGYYDHAEHQGSTGRALLPLAHAGNKPDLVIPRLQVAIDQQSASYPRSRTFSRIRLATITMSLIDPHHGAHLGQRALSDARHLRSRRIRDELRRLYRASTPYATLSDVSDLRDALHALPTPV